MITRVLILMMIVMTYYANYVNEILLMCIIMSCLLRSPEVVFLVKLSLQIKRIKIMNSQEILLEVYNENEKK